MGIRRFLRRSRQDRERADEIASHIAEATAYYVRSGMAPDEAARTARLKFGNTRAHREKVDDMNRLPVMDSLGRDLRFAFRRLRKAPGFSLAVILTLGLVIGATSAVFSLADAILLTPLPVPHPDRLMFLSFQVSKKTGEQTQLYSSVDGAMFRSAHAHATLVDTAIFGRGAAGVNFVSGNSPSFVQNQQVGAGFFHVLGVPPAIGREFSEQDVQTGGPALAILSHAFWNRVFTGRPDVVGQTILLRGEPYQVIGVMPPMSIAMVDADVWTPLRNPGGGINYQALARLRDGATPEAAKAELLTLGDDPFTLWKPLSDEVNSLTLQDVQSVLVSDARGPLEMLGWAVGAVLLIACVNIAALLLARGGSRAKEVATRMALGSGRVAVIRQLMVESAVLALIGGALGVVVGAGLLEALKSLGGTTFAEWQDVALDGRTVAAALGLSALTSLVFGLLPAWQTSRIDVQRTLASGGSRSIAGGSKHFARRALVVSEVALGVVLLVSAGLLMRQFLSLRLMDPGFTPDRLYTVGVSLKDARYEDPAAVHRLFTASLEQLRQTPGIEAATISQRLPYERLLNNVFRIEGDTTERKRPPLADFSYVAPSFFDTFGIRIVRGRALQETDGAGAPAVVVVNETFARIYFKDQSIVGHRLLLGNRPVEIVGVSHDVQQHGVGFFVTGMRRSPLMTSPTVYVPEAQADPDMFRWFSPTWTVRAGSPAVAEAAFNRALGAVDPLLPHDDMRAMTGVMRDSIAEPRLMMSLVGALAIAALLLAAIGIHGLITHIVSDRMREFGIKLALGASARQIIVAVAGSGVILAALGAVVGLALSFYATKLVEASLTELTAKDVPTYLGVAALLFVVAAASSVWPALRVSRLNPVTTLRD